ncbi:MAG: glycosyltransferase, partial [Candidatus Omnitrophota bacterium]
TLADAGIFFINPYKKIGSSPIKMGEFLASGVPVVINPGVGDTEELVAECGVGVVVRAFDSGCYEDAVGKLLGLIGEKGALRGRCLDSARKHLSVEMGAARYSKIYEILDRGRA